MLSKTVFATAILALATSVAAAPVAAPVALAQPDLKETLTNLLSPGSANKNTGSLLSPGSDNANLGNLLSPGSDNSALNGNSAEDNGNGEHRSLPRFVDIMLTLYLRKLCGQWFVLDYFTRPIHPTDPPLGNSAGNNNGNGNSVDGNSLINLSDLLDVDPTINLCKH
ncbi:hypothetical protein E4T39_02174 [Aureobasidium subglaciale]|nr:hypothetical protein E4T39_02174 [Aureobasidium subglaciale]